MTGVTYLGQPELKAALLREIGKHEAADQITKGTYGAVNGLWHGCAIGCSLRSLNLLQGRHDPNAQTGDHARYETELGLPIWLAYLEDHLFEQLPDDQATTWPRRFAEAIPVGAVVTDRVLAKILRWTLGAETYGARYAATDPAVMLIIDRMIALFDRSIRGDEPPSTEWKEAARAAWDARAAWAAWDARAARAAWDAWDARAARAAWDAWDARAARAVWAVWAARAAWNARAARAARDAWDAWDAWNARAARAGFYPALSAYVLDLLSTLPVPAQMGR